MRETGGGGGYISAGVPVPQLPRANQSDGRWKPDYNITVFMNMACGTVNRRRCAFPTRRDIRDSKTEIRETFRGRRERTESEM